MCNVCESVNTALAFDPSTKSTFAVVRVYVFRCKYGQSHIRGWGKRECSAPQIPNLSRLQNGHKRVRQSETSHNRRRECDRGQSRLHIIGGTSNDKHISIALCDLSKPKKSKSKSLKIMHSFRDRFPQIQSCALIHSSVTHEICMFGGRSSSERQSFADFWCFDTANPLAQLSMRECAWLLVNGFVCEEIYFKNNQFEIDYPLELNGLILRFLGVFNTINHWQKSEECALPKAIYQFGYVIYRQRVVLTFGGRDETNECIDDIYSFVSHKYF